MREQSIKIPELAMIAATRGMLGVGIGLLISERLSRHRRSTVGWTLFVIGAVSTIPLAVRMFQRNRNHEPMRGRGRDSVRDSVIVSG